MTQSQEIGKINQCNECRERKFISAVVFHEKEGWVKYCLECLHKSELSKNIEQMREVIFKPEVICEKHNQPKKLWKKGGRGIYEPYCFTCDSEELKKSLTSLYSDPLKIAKFFLEKGADTWPTIQRLVFLAYIRSLKQKKILFEEKFEKWESSPVLISLYEKSTNKTYYLSPTTVLKEVEEPTEPFIRNLLTDVYQNYERYEDEERIFNLIVTGLFAPNEENEPNLRTYPWKTWEEKGYILSYAS